MADGQRADIQLGYGDRHHPLCKLKCRGTERNRLDSPARFGRTPDGEKVMYCSCCNTRLREARPGETGLKNGSALALADGVQSAGRVMVDDICGYEAVWLKELKATP